MRLWTVHPKYLDRQGLGGVWREGLGAQQNLIADLEGRKIGYDGHPQLERFRAHAHPLDALTTYMIEVWEEAFRRGYYYDKSKLVGNAFDPEPGGFSNHHIPVTTEQLGYEKRWLYWKLTHRADPSKKADWERAQRLVDSELSWHPLFTVHYGPLASWERPVDLEEFYTKEVGLS